MANSEWQTVSIDDIKAATKSSIAIGPFGSRLKADSYTESGVPIIRGNNLTGTKYFTNDFVYVSDAKADELASSIVYADDLVFPHRGNIGTVGIVPNDQPRYLLSTSLMKLTVDKKRVDPTFLFYYFTSEIGKHELLKNASQAGTPGIATPLSSLKGIKFLLPPLVEQRYIAHILGTLDDKIELNRQLNATLEQLARALFQSWFVDFDPVRAKASGEPADSICRRLGLTPELLALFPAELEASALGEVPVGWEVTSVGELTNLIKGRSYKSDELKPSDTALVTLKSIHRGGGYRLDGLKSFTGVYKAEQEVAPGELVVALTDVTQAADVIGQPALITKGSNFATLVASLDLMIVRPKNELIGTHFFNNLFQTYSFRTHILGHTNGTTVLHLAKSGIPTYKFPLPPIELTSDFEQIAAANWALISRNEQEIRTLTALRDELLPKLISGELNVSDKLYGAAKTRV